MSYCFHPPRTNPAVVRLVNFAFPFVLPIHEDVVRVLVDDRDWQRLASIPGRALLLPNHPSETEPVIMAWLARKLDEPFNYVATHEIFAGPRGWLVNRIGAFSIRRGCADRPSLKMSVRLLAELDRKLVIFAEGETHMQNDLILPLHDGALQIAFWSLDKIADLGKPLTLPALPIIIRYRCVGDPRPVLHRGLSRVERQLGLQVGSPEAIPARLRAAGWTVLDGVEREYGLSSENASDMNTRIRALYRLITERVARVLNVPSPGDQPVHLGMRRLYVAAFDYVDGLANQNTAYERRLHQRRMAAGRACLNDLDRVHNFMVIREECMAEPMTAERAGEVLWRLEKEAFGKGHTRAPREAVVRIGEPVELADSLADYRADKRGTVKRCTGRMEDRLRALLESTADLGTPL